MQRRFLALASASIVLGSLLLGVTPAGAHETGAYSHESSLGYTNASWMGRIPGQLKLSELSIPGTHDTIAFYGGDKAQAQTLPLATQLRSGIRVLDIRARHINDVFAIHHGPVFQNAFFGGDVMEPVIDFLRAHPSETVLIRLKQEHSPEDNTREFHETFAWYLQSYGAYVWNGTSDNPTLDEVRGKIVILQNWAEGPDYGLAYGSFTDQDNFDIGDITGLYDKWLDVKAHLVAADRGDLGTFYVNYLSGSDKLLDVYPYFVASGHSNSATGAPRLATGKTTPGWSDWPDFPRVDCAPNPIVGWGDICTIAYEGTNVLAMDYINAGNVSRRIGIIMSDFPGAGLIDSVIAMNPWNWPPVAHAGGPYVADEGSAITFTAAGSTDRDGDALQYRWDFDGDENWDTPFSTSPTATHTWADDWGGSAIVEVKDHAHSDTASVSVTVNNVAPVITVDGDAIDEDGVATVSGTITDPGIEDTFDVVIDWGEGTPETFSYGAGATSFSETHQYLDDDPTGTASDTYPIEVTVTDDDDGQDVETTKVVVDNLAPVTTVNSVRDETGTEVGTGQRVVLPLLEIDLWGSFTDVGTQDTHTAVVDWRDGQVDDVGATTGAITASHVFSTPGLYVVEVPVTDDDTETGTGTWSVTVVDAAGAMQNAVDRLSALAVDPATPPDAVPALEQALGHLTGQASGAAANGALPLLEDGQLVAALQMLELTITDLQLAEANGAGDLTDVKSLLALIAKSIALDAIQRAEAVATRRADLRKVATARALVSSGDAALSGQSWATAVDWYQQAVREVQPLIP